MLGLLEGEHGQGFFASCGDSNFLFLLGDASFEGHMVHAVVVDHEDACRWFSSHRPMVSLGFRVIKRFEYELVGKGVCGWERWIVRGN
jgi:hypothetical protein